MSLIYFLLILLFYTSAWDSAWGGHACIASDLIHQAVFPAALFIWVLMWEGCSKLLWTLPTNWDCLEDCSPAFSSPLEKSLLFICFSESIQLLTSSWKCSSHIALWSTHRKVKLLAQGNSAGHWDINTIYKFDSAFISNYWVKRPLYSQRAPVSHFSMVRALYREGG